MFLLCFHHNHHAGGCGGNLKASVNNFRNVCDFVNQCVTEVTV